jgi:DNA-binding NarL/FixJ family response regulator
MTSDADAYARLRREVERVHDGLRAPLTRSELDGFARQLRPDADECHLEIQNGDDGPLIIVRATKRAASPAAPALASLSTREREVALCIARGLTNPAIARELKIRPSTVKDHVHNILTRLGLASRSQIAAAVARAPLLRTTSR